MTDTAVRIDPPSSSSIRLGSRPRSSSYTPPDDLFAPPSNTELYWYIGSQPRWVQLVMTLGFLLSASSLVRFAMSAVWLYPVLITLLVSILSSVLSMFSGLHRGRVTRTSHNNLVAVWLAATPRTAMPSVDVFLPSAGEDLRVLRNTFVYVSELRWAGVLKVWVMDDADKPAVAALAAEFGFDYIVRPDRGVMKKAGNLRSAFNNTSGEFILVLDADFCPRADFLEHTLPYMRDRDIGIVQTPQFFDAHTGMGWLQRTAGATQELFYRWVQPSRDRAGAPICVGTCAVYRRSALSAVGGFAKIEHSEDVHTGIALLRGGYTTRYVPIVVSRGLCPDDLAGFLNQQYRWCNGSITLLNSGVAQRRPLTLWQRVCFWSGFLYYISTAVSVFAVHLPGLIMAIWFPENVRAVQFVPFLVGAWVYFVVMPRMSKTTWRFEVVRVQMAYSFSHAVALAHKLTGRTSGWVPTGAVGKKNSLARTISAVGATTLTLLVGTSWIAFFVDVSVYGLQQFWPMGVFLVAYSYLAVPLTWGFLQVLIPALGGTKGTTGVRTSASPTVDGTSDDHALDGASRRHNTSRGRRRSDSLGVGFFYTIREDVEGGRITMIEAVAYTALIGMIAVTALGWFDAMIPWAQ